MYGLETGDHKPARLDSAWSLSVTLFFILCLRVSRSIHGHKPRDIHASGRLCASWQKQARRQRRSRRCDVVCLLSLLELRLKLRDVVLFPLWEEKEAPASLFLFQLRLHRLQLNTIISQKQRRRPAAPANLYTHSSCSEKHLERCCIRQPADPYPRVNEWYAMPAPSAN